MFWDVPGCSGMFHVPDFIDAHAVITCTYKEPICTRKADVKVCDSPGTDSAKFRLRKQKNIRLYQLG